MSNFQRRPFYACIFLLFGNSSVKCQDSTALSSPFCCPNHKNHPTLFLSVPLLSCSLSPCHPFFFFPSVLPLSPSHRKSKSESVFIQSPFPWVSLSSVCVCVCRGDKSEVFTHTHTSERSLYLEPVSRALIKPPFYLLHILNCRSLGRNRVINFTFPLQVEGLRFGV